MDLTKTTAAEIDGQLAALYYAEGRAELTLHSMVEIMRRIAGEDYTARRQGLRMPAAEAEARTRRIAQDGTLGHDRQQAERAVAAVDQARDVIAEAVEAAKPLNAEYQRRGGWTRAFLVRNVNGHVHSSMACSTCFPTTEYEWMTTFSGNTEEEIVKAAGWRACTVCYPSAPVAVLKGATEMFTADEVAAKAARDERARVKAARDAAKAAKAIDLRNLRFPRETYANWKTAQSDLVDHVADHVATRNSVNGQYDLNAAWVAEALAKLAAKLAKSVEDYRSEITGKVVAKVRKDWHQPAVDATDVPL